VRDDRAGGVIGWAYIAVILVILYLPLVPPILFSLTTRAAEEGDLSAYGQLWDNPILPQALRTTALVGLLAAIATPILGLLASMAIRELKIHRLLLLMILVPLFVPGVSMGVATAFFFRQLGIESSLLTIAVVHVMWALPFATLIILTVMAGFDPVYLEAAYMHGANRLRAFVDIELPLIWPGIFGASLFSMILSFNETVRTALVQGPYNTVQTYIWANYLQVGLSPTLYALMSLLIVLTLALVTALLVIPLLRARARPQPAAAARTSAPLPAR
jgi:ABC-type spermidine/putrescine transport system permease subunit II